MTDRDLADLAREYPDWSLWRSTSTEGRPGDYYATRPPFPRPPEGAARTLTAPTLADLARRLLEQAQASEGSRA